MQKTEWTIKSAAGSAAGMGVGIYVGLNILVPAASAAAVWFLGKRINKAKDPLFLGAIACLAGHLTWITVGSAIFGAWQANWIDICVMLALSVWLWVRPNLSAVACLTVAELLALVVNGLVIAAHAPGSATHKALFLHLVLRCVTVFLAWHAYIARRRLSGG